MPAGENQMNRKDQSWVNIFIAVLIVAAIAYFAVYYAISRGLVSLPAGDRPAVSSNVTDTAPATAMTKSGDAQHVYYGKQPSYDLYKGGPLVHLVENPQAADPTWQQLRDFVASDATDRDVYDAATFPCAAFAEKLHNNAEAHGIRAAWVALDFEGATIGHAIDAFETTDRGLVYVDCTGDKSGVVTHQTASGKKEKVFGNPASCDRIAYVQIGKEYGVISLEVAASPEYDYYVQYRQNLAKFEAGLAAYNSDVKKWDLEVAQFNQWVGGRTFKTNSADYKKAQQWQDQLESRGNELDKTSKYLDQLGDSLGAFWTPKGIVKSVGIYW